MDAEKKLICNLLMCLWIVKRLSYVFLIHVHNTSFNIIGALSLFSALFFFPFRHFIEHVVGARNFFFNKTWWMLNSEHMFREINLFWVCCFHDKMFFWNSIEEGLSRLLDSFLLLIKCLLAGSWITLDSRIGNRSSCGKGKIL